MELILKNVKKKIYHFKIVGKSLGLNWKENKPYNQICKRNFGGRERS
jgi:hypothetical protein